MKQRPGEQTAEGLPLSTLEFRVLLVLMGADLHGYGLAKEVGRRDPSLGKILPTNFYRRLSKLVDRGWIEHLPASSGGDSRRKFRITELGRQVARAEALRLEKLVLDARYVMLAPNSESR